MIVAEGVQEGACKLRGNDLVVTYAETCGAQTQVVVPQKNVQRSRIVQNIFLSFQLDGEAQMHASKTGLQAWLMAVQLVGTAHTPVQESLHHMDTASLLRLLKVCMCVFVSQKCAMVYDRAEGSMDLC